MLSLNLIPTKLKDEMKMQKISSSVTLILLFISFFLFLLTSSLLYGLYYLNDMNKQLLFIVENSADSASTFTKEVEAINSKTKYIAKIQDDYTYWTIFLHHLGELSSEGLSFDSIRINKEENSLNLSGKALTRDALLDFKQKIEEDPYLSDVDFPLNTLFEKENIDFSIKATISSYEFNKL